MKDYGNISDEEKRKRNAEDIARAKDTIGKVVQIEFREEKSAITDADKKARQKLAENALSETKDTPFDTVGAKYRDQYENVGYVSTGGALIPQAEFNGYQNITTFPYVSPVHYVAGEETLSADESGKTVATRAPGGYAITYLEKALPDIEIPAIGTGSATKKKQYQYALIYIDERPSLWEIARTLDGKSLSDKYLTRAGVSFTQAGAPQVELIFNDEGKKIFGELTKRLLGKRIAIYVGGQMLTAPTVQAVIPDGRAVITGDYTIASAQELANNINTGIVPAPIYLTSERTIDAKIGKNALSEILKAGLIGLFAIVVLLVIFYRVSGLIA